MTAIMFDIEALDIRPTAAIASIGAVLFEPHSDWIGDTFHLHVSLENCQRHGLTFGASTITWWMAQDEPARQMLINGQIDAAPLISALGSFSAFCPADADIWCNGNSYDLPILANAYHTIGIDTPWHFFNERDLRTLKGLNKALRIERSGTYHNALDDAIHQAKLVQHILQFGPRRMKTKPIDLPLEPEITGCLAHTQHVGQWCEKYLTCACHQTIALDNPAKPRNIMLRKCSDDAHRCYMPVDGFDLGDDEAVAYQAEGGAA